MEKKQLSAVEWLIDELTRLGHNFKLYKREINQAKQMEREQKAEIIKNIRSYGK